MSPFLFTILPNCLDMGMSEDEFWDMTLAEIERFCESFKRRQEQRYKEKAQFDYVLADLIGVSVARTQSKKVKYPAIEKVYPNLFDSPEEQQKKQDKQSTINFINFAQSFNKNIKQEGE